jgi:hypothetical protein
MKRLTRTLLLAIAVNTLALSQIVNNAAACPNCKEAVSLDAGEVAQMASGYNWSVTFMLVVPFSMLGTGVFFVRRAVRQGTLPEM